MVDKPKDDRQGFGPDGEGEECKHDPKLVGTGGVFLQSTGWILCSVCRGYQRIRKPIK